MKVLMINGSPHAKGSTYTALSYVAEELNSVSPLRKFSPKNSNTSATMATSAIFTSFVNILFISYFSYIL